jgi:hypothetical protein
MSHERSPLRDDGVKIDRERVTETSSSIDSDMQQRIMNYPAHIRELESQEYWERRAGAQIKKLVELSNPQDVEKKVKSEGLLFFDTIASDFAERPDVYISSFEDALAPQNQQTYAETAYFLRALEQLQKSFQKHRYQFLDPHRIEESMEQFARMLDRITTKQDHSLFLTIKLEELSKKFRNFNLESNEEFLERERDRIKPFADHVFMRTDFHGSHLISEPEHYEKILELNEEKKNLMDVVYQFDDETRSYSVLDDTDERRVRLEKINENLSSFVSIPLMEVDPRIQRVDSTPRPEDRSDFLAMADPFFREVLEKKLHISLSELSLREQYYLMSFLKETSVQDASQVTFFSEKFGPDGLRTFLSIDYFGKDFGQQILSLQENASRKDLQGIFSKYASITRSLEQFESRVAALEPEALVLDKDLAVQMIEGLQRRTSDLLLSAHEIVRREGASDLEFTLTDVERALSGLEKFVAIFADSAKHEKFEYRKIPSTRNFRWDVTELETGKEYVFRIFVRSEEDNHGQARINFELDFDTTNPNTELKEAFAQSTTYLKDKKTVEESVLRVAIDRDTRTQQEMISLDVGRSPFSGENIQRKGDILGRLLSLVSESGHHTFVSFDQRYARSNEFKRFADAFKKHLSSL